MNIAVSVSSPPRYVSPAPSTPTPFPVAGHQNQVPNRKRKHAAIAGSMVAESSPAPQDGSSTPAENVVLPARHDLSSRAQLSISRFPNFLSNDEHTVYHTTEQLAMNRLGFRYTPAGVTPPGSTLPCRTIESAPTLYRVSWEDRSPFIKVTADGLCLLGDKGFRSARCNAPLREGRWYMEIRIERGGGGHAPDVNLREGSHVRLGWGRREAPLNAPVGLDGYSYGVRDKTGEKVTLSRPKPYGRPFSSGDVIGMYIALPPRRQPDHEDPYDPAHIKRERIAIEFKGQEYFESLEYTQSKEMMALMDYSNKAASTSSLPSSSTKKSATVKNLPQQARNKSSTVQPESSRPLPTLPASHISFFVNGECQGIAFQELYDYLPLRAVQASRKAKEKKRGNKEGAREHKENPFDDGSLGYYPFISLFNHACVKINPGPEFEYPPPPDIDQLLANPGEVDVKPGVQRTWRPVCERYREYMEEQWSLDDREEEEARAEAASSAQREQAEAEKAAQLEKRRLQAEARRKARKAAQEAQKQREFSAAIVDECIQRSELEAVPPSASSPVSFSTLQVPGFAISSSVGYDSVIVSEDQGQSPAPTATSSMEYHGVHSGYNSDNMEVEVEGEAEDVMEPSTGSHKSDGVSAMKHTI